MANIVFSTDQSPGHLPPVARASAWLERLETTYNVEVEPLRDVPFSASFVGTLLGETVLSMQRGALRCMRRTSKAIVADGRSSSILIVNLGGLINVVQGGREIMLAKGQATIFDESRAGHFDIPHPGPRTPSILFPRQALSAAVRNSEDLALKPIDPGSELLRMLTTYGRTILAEGGSDDPAAAQVFSSHLVDLAALMFGTSRDTAEIASRGLRAGRLKAVLAAINAGFANPSFSIHEIARNERVSERYLHDLLYESGVSFTERVLELRLQRAYRFLTRWQHGHRKVTDIAFAVGFNDVSYFHRCFRGRFGMTPGDARKAATNGDLMADGTLAPAALRPLDSLDPR